LDRSSAQALLFFACPSPKVVRRYARQSRLQAPERTLLRAAHRCGADRQRHWVELIDPLAGGCNCYVRPAELVRQTLAQGFEDVQCVDLLGREIDDPQQRAQLPDAWIYVHARASR
jgi:hypothetical protein